MLKKALKFIIIAILLIIATFILFLAWQSVTEFDPPAELVLAQNPDAPAVDDSFSIISWNVGYFGLGAEMDFFYEGGKMVRPTIDQYGHYSKEGLLRIMSFDTAAFIFLQEVDTLSRRSHWRNQLQALRMLLPGHQSFPGINYNAWVPVPITAPMGKVRAGLVTLSRFTPVSAKRISFESSYSWPMRLFMLKRCFVELRFNTANGRQLVLINTHNSAFGDAAALREKELSTLKDVMLNEYAKGNYVIVGGDWNQNPPAFDSTQVLPRYKTKRITPGIPANYMPEDWTYAFDPRYPTNRDVNISYIDGKTITTLIDFFVVSPNVTLNNVQALPTGFSESDHFPVSIGVTLK